MTLKFALIDSHIESSEESLLHGKFIPYGLNFLYNALKNSGYEGSLVLEPHEYKDFIEHSGEIRRTLRMIGISCATLTRFDAKSKIEECREKFPDSIIIAGGPHFGNSAEEALEYIPELDVVVRGEGDEVIIDLMKYSETLVGIKKIKGITYRDTENQVVSNGPKLIVDDLPDIRFIKNTYSEAMFNENPLHPDMPIPSMNVLAGRGCPYNCIFCSVNRTKSRMYPVKDIVDLIEDTVKKYKIKGVKFYDDSLTLNAKYVYSLCAEIKKRDLEIYWFCDSRANIDLDLLPEMYSAGCRFIAVGLETGSPKIQDVIKKKISNEMLIEFAQKCKAVGISTYIFMMASLPDETPADLEMTVDVAKLLSKKCKAVAGSMGATVIVPGSQIETIAKERGVLPSDFSWYKPYYNPINLEYELPPTLPMYIEHITPELYRDAKRKMLANYADSLGFKKLILSSYKNLLRTDISFYEKMRMGWHVFIAKLGSLFS